MEEAAAATTSAAADKEGAPAATAAEAKGAAKSWEVKPMVGSKGGPAKA